MKYNIILASNSPRRQQLLTEIGFAFTVKTKPVDEDYPEDVPVIDVAEYLARKKGKVYQLDLLKEDLVITADTVVVVGDTILNKPKDFEEAQHMLSLLSGKNHQVITGVCLTTKDKQVSFRDVTLVYFKVLKDQEINYYIHHYQPYDKAGGYAIQEWIGMIGIKKIEGSYFNVVGLPVAKLYEYLTEIEDKEIEEGFTMGSQL